MDTGTHLVPGWRRLLDGAAGRFGTLTLDQAIHAGLSREQVQGLLDDGTLVRVARGSDRVGGAPVTFPGRVLGAIAVYGTDTWAARDTCLALRGVRGFPPGGPIHLLRRDDGSNQRGGARVHRSRLILPHHVTVQDGMPVTTPARAVFDLAATMGPNRLARVVSEVVRAELCTDGGLQVVLAELGGRGRPGTARLRAVLDARDHTPTESELEDLARAVFRAAGLPEPEWQVDVSDHEGWIGRVDCLFRPAKVIVELDSVKWHGQETDDDHDAVRDVRCVEAGYLVTRPTWRDLTKRPEAVVANLRELIRARVAA
jgi:Protein of unknown function (DUF559)